MTTSIAFVDDHPLLLAGLASIFDDNPRFKVAATGRNATEAVEIVQSLNPDVVLLDLNMPGDAFAAITKICEAGKDTRVIAFTASAGIDHAVRALEAGAIGYVLKGATDKELLLAIDTVMSGATFITPSFATKVIGALRSSSGKEASNRQIKFSVREDQIVRLLLIGRTNKEIAQRLKISEKTVKHYMTVLMHKLSARNRVEVVLAAQELGGYVANLDSDAARDTFLN